MLLTAFENLKERDKDNVEVVSIRNNFLKKDTQIKLKRHFLFLIEDLFFNKSFEKNTNWKNYFLTVSIVGLDDSSKKGMI